MTTELKDKLTEIQEKLNELVQLYGYDDTKLAFNTLKIPNETTQKAILEGLSGLPNEPRYKTLEEALQAMKEIASE